MMVFCAKNRAQGFTLLELALVVAIIGLLLSSLFTMAKVYMRQYEREVNADAIAAIQSALEQFKSARGYFPCPAPPALPLGHPMHGKELRHAAAADIPLGASLGRCVPAEGLVAGEATADGIIRAPGWRVNSTTGLPGNVIGAQVFPIKTAALSTGGVPANDTSVYIGDIPYLTISEVTALPLKSILDAYGQKFIYVVSAPLTHGTTYDDMKPNITIRKFNYAHTGPAVRTMPRGNRSATWAIISSGPDRLGSYNKQGIRLNPCPAVAEADATFSRRENCDGDAIFLSTAGANRHLSHTNAAGNTTYFDDIIEATFVNETLLWKMEADDNMRSANLTGNVGIGHEPIAQTRLSVNGDIRSDKVFANSICGPSAVVGGAILPNDARCFDPRALAGNPDAATPTGGMKCPVVGGVQWVLVRIGAGGALPTPPGAGVMKTFYTCAPPRLNAPALGGQSCPAGRWLLGYRSDGTLECS